MAISETPVSPDIVFSGIEGLVVRRDALLSDYTRFGIGGPADFLAETADEDAFVSALRWLRERGVPHAVIGAGTNLIVADEGFRGTVLRYTASTMTRDGLFLKCDAGTSLMQLVQFSVDQGLAGIQTLMGIPGSVGAAVYGNAGAYGHSISEVVREVRFFDGEGVSTLDGEACRFQYRESVFKQNRHWRVLGVRMQFREGDASVLHRQAGEILSVRNEKFPPTMHCAGSIFKNLLAARLPEFIAAGVPAGVVREGKIPAAWFLEQVGAKGSREGGIHIAPYHANLIFNAGGGTARQLCAMIDRLKDAVFSRFGILLEEEVQYLGFADR